MKQIQVSWLSRASCKLFHKDTKNHDMKIFPYLKALLWGRKRHHGACPRSSTLRQLSNATKPFMSLSPRAESSPPNWRKGRIAIQHMNRKAPEGAKLRSIR